MRVLIGAIIQETNTFSPVPGDIDDFRSLYYLKGEDIPRALSESSTEISGMYEVFRASGHRVIPTVAAMATSGGRLTNETYERLRDDLLTPTLAGPRPDAVLLALHGAMCTEKEDDGDGAILRDLRDAIGAECPVFVTHDLHANLTEQRARLCDALIGYRTSPHIDHRETGVRAAQLLVRTLATGAKPKNVMRKIPMIAPSVRQNTSLSPLGPIMERARKFEGNQLTPAVSCFWMQPWLNVKEAGASVNVVSYGSVRDAQHILNELGQSIWRTRHELDVKLWNSRDAIRDVKRKEGRPFVFSDTGDAPPAGAPGDSNYLLQDFIDEGFDDLVLLTLRDGDAAREMHAAGVGATLTVDLGGAISSVHCFPRKYTGCVRRLSDGRFRYEGPIARGQEANIGASAIFQIGRIHVLVHERSALSHDPAIFKSFGYDVKKAKIVVAKSPTQFRACYEPIAAGIYEIETPGISTVNLTSLDFNRIPRPAYPFDPDDRVAQSWFSKVPGGEELSE